MKKLFLILLAALLLLAVACATPEQGETPPVQTGETETPAPAPEPEPEPEVTVAPVPAPMPEPDPEPEPEPEPEEPRPPEPVEPELEPYPEDNRPLSERVAGEWYADYAGLVITLALAEDGSYTFTTPGAEPLTGQWEIRDGVLVFDGVTDDVLLPVGDILRWESANLLFTREQPEAYLPGEIAADAKEGSFDGYWKASYVGAAEGAVYADALHEDTEVYIEGTNVALGGKRFGEVIRVFSFANAALTLDENGTTVTLQMQTDGCLRMTLTGAQNAVIYLMRAEIPGIAE